MTKRLDHEKINKIEAVKRQLIEESFHLSTNIGEEAQKFWEACKQYILSGDRAAPSIVAFDIPLHVSGVTKKRAQDIVNGWLREANLPEHDFAAVRMDIYSSSTYSEGLEARVAMLGRFWLSGAREGMKNQSVMKM